MRRPLTCALLVALLAAAPAGAAFTGEARRGGGGARAAEVFAPRPATPPAVPGTPEQGRPLTAFTGGWERQPTHLDVRWLRCSEAGCEPLAGATDTTYVPTADDVGRRLRVEVTATNAGGSAVAASTLSAPVAGLRPVSTAVPTFGGSAVQGERLSATSGGWSGAEALAHEWRRCPAAGGACTRVDGATGTTYTTTVADLGHRMRVAVHATNEAGTTTALSATGPVIVERTRERAYLLAVRRDGPAALYDFNEHDGRDTSGHGRTATAFNVAFGQAGALDGSAAARLDGTDAYLELPWSPTCGVSGFTYEGWVWWQTARGYERIFDFGDRAAGSYLALTPAFGTTGLMYGMAWVDGQDYDLRGAPALALWTWKHVALTFDADRRMTIYVDGVAQASGTAPWRPADIGCHPHNWIGRSLYAADPFFGGVHDDVALYDRALSAAEIRAHIDAR